MKHYISSLIAHTASPRMDLLCGMQGTFLTSLLELASWTFRVLEPILEVSSEKEGDKVK